MKQTDKYLKSAEAVSITGTAAAIVMTVMLHGSNYATEGNPVAGELIGTLGYSLTALVALLLIGGCHTVFKWVADRGFDQAAVGAAAIPAIISVGDVVVNVWVLSQTGLPDTVPQETGEAVAIAGLVGVIIFGRSYIKPVTRRIVTKVKTQRPSAGQIRSLFMIALIIGSILGGVGFTDEKSPVKTVSAASTSAGVISSFENSSFPNIGSKMNLEQSTKYSTTGDASVALNDTSGGFDAKFTVSRPSSVNKWRQFSIDFRVESINNTEMSIHSTNSGAWALNIDIKNGDILVLRGGGNVKDTGIDYKADTWYTLEITDVDYSNYNYDIILKDKSGNVIGSYTNAKFEDSTSQMDYVSISYTSKTNIHKMYADQFTYGGYEPTKTIAGSVTDQSGAPVGNATVEVWGVKSGVSNPTETIDTITDPIPPKFSSSASPLQNTQDTRVAVAYEEEQLGLRAWVDNPQTDKPKVANLPAGEEIALGVVDPTQGDGLFENEYDASVTGSFVDDTIVVESVGPGGSTTQKITLQTDERAGGVTGGEAGQMEYASTSLPAGFYRIYPKGSPESAYLIQVGDLSSTYESIREDLKTTAGTVSDRAKTVRNAKLVEVTTTTNSNGEWTVSVPKSVQKVSVQAYSAGGELLSESAKNRSLSDIKQARQNGYDGSVIVSSEVETATPPASGVQVTVQRVNAPLQTNISQYQQNQKQWRKYFKNWTATELPGLIRQNTDNVSKADLKALKANMSKTIAENQQLIKQYRNEIAELKNKEPEQVTVNVTKTDYSQKELKKRVKALDQTVQQLESKIATEKETTKITNKKASYTAVLPASVDEDDVTVLATVDGKTTPVPAKYITVKDDGIGPLGGSTVKVTDYPVPASAPGVEFQMVGITQNDEVVKSTAAAENPAFDGETPGLSAIKISTTHPQPGQTVTVSMTPDKQVNFGGLTGVTVIGPSGNNLNTSISNGQATFTVQNAGTHYIEVRYSNPGGQTFTRSVRIDAVKSSLDTGPTIRLEESADGQYAVVSGLMSASVEQQRGVTQIDAVLAENQPVPSEIHVYTSSTTPESTVEVSLHRGENKKDVSKRSKVIIHTQLGNGESTVYRDTGSRRNPIPASGEGKWGSVKQSEDGTRIITFTGADGSVTVNSDTSPSLIEEIQHEVELQITQLPVPF